MAESTLTSTNKRLGINLIVAWALSQGVWLLFAYLLEFEGWNTFRPLLASGILFFTANIWCICEVARGYIEFKPVTELRRSKRKKI